MQDEQDVRDDRDPNMDETRGANGLFSDHVRPQSLEGPGDREDARRHGRVEKAWPLAGGIRAALQRPHLPEAVEPRVRSGTGLI